MECRRTVSYTHLMKFWFITDYNLFKSALQPQYSWILIDRGAFLWIAMILRHRLIRSVSIDSPSNSPTPMFSMPVRICAIASLLYSHAVFSDQFRNCSQGHSRNEHLRTVTKYFNTNIPESQIISTTVQMCIRDRGFFGNGTVGHGTGLESGHNGLYLSLIHI